MVKELDKVRKLVTDLRVMAPRSPREKLAGYVILARSVDKCRAFLLGINEEYNYQPCSLAAHFFKFTGITAEQLEDFIATGATDAEIAEWVKRQAGRKTPMEIIRWNNTLRDMRISEMDDHAQEYLEEYIDLHLPPNKPVYHWFDVYDIEEKRL
jgi:Domain of unknown function (DUF5069)